MKITCKTVLVICLSAALALSGCGSHASSDDIQIMDALEQDVSDAVPDAGKYEEADDTSDYMSDSTPDSTPDDLKKAAVYGNGSYFVRVGEEVFYHSYEKLPYGESAPGGQFLPFGRGICSYDEATGKITELSAEPCSGKLFYCGNEFYSTCEEENEPSRIVRISMDGETFRVGPGTVEGISPDGRLVALMCDDASIKHLDIIDESHTQCIRVDKPEDGSLAFCALTDKEVIYEKSFSDRIELCSMGDDGEEVLLGVLSETGIYGSLECDDFLMDDENGDVYCVFAHYDGPVDSVGDYIVVKLAPGKEGGLELITHGYNNEMMPNIGYDDEPFLRVNNGELSFASFDENKLYLSHSYLGSHMLSRFEYGNLLWSDNEGQAQTMIKSFIPYMDRDSFVMQTGEILGDEAYVLVAGVNRDPGSDYKLSQAFEFKGMYILRIPSLKDPSIEVVSGGDFEKELTFDKKGYEPYIGTWRMDDFIIEDGYEPDHSRNMWIGINDEQELTFMDNEEYSGFPFMLSTSDAGDECLIVGYNEVLELTCTGRYTNDSGEEKLILEVQERKESIDDPGPASWKGVFHRVSDEEWSVEW